MKPALFLSSLFSAALFLFYFLSNSRSVLVILPLAHPGLFGKTLYLLFFDYSHPSRCNEPPITHFFQVTVHSSTNHTGCAHSAIFSFLAVFLLLYSFVSFGLNDTQIPQILLKNSLFSVMLADYFSFLLPPARLSC